ncbi:EMBRYO SAC DEVELOPMENT ARREST 3, chloroplastic [Olea europaea subsp. europaea]|uniref:EMBRYO SAC DEVELOPMENT ARREST 3, chloroplastic n=1 Tax=Olea europaea subsp. europaea TaxID=158383 RepID=A0A8S0PWP1_OLEEU|nr:EMBRYO SAC DEVELOPMENT ARREST 3, chloroplastic [Olea europaea subsp. europaea]
MSSSCSFCCRPINLCPIKTVMSPGKVEFITPRKVRFHFGRIRASKVESYGSSPDFVERMERAWLISQQPRPVACSSCDSNGNVECKWCSGTGFFIIGDNMLCQVPSRNTACVICAGKGSVCCSDCKGTGFRAKWLGEPPVAK